MPVVLPPSVRELAERFTVAGRIGLFQRKLSFGPYTAVDVSIHAGGMRYGATIFNGNQDRSEDHHVGKFVLATESGAFDGKCEHFETSVVQHEEVVREVNDHIRVLDNPRVVSSSWSYSCTIKQSNGAVLQLQQDRGGRGSVQGAETLWSIARVDEQLTPVPLAWGMDYGQLLMSDEVALGAIDSSDFTSSVTLARSASQLDKDRVAAVATALLLRRDMF